MYQHVKTSSWLYCICSWGLLCFSLSVSLLSSFNTPWILENLMLLSALAEVVVVAAPGLVFLCTRAGRAFRARFNPRSIGKNMWAVLPIAIGGFCFFTGLNGIVTGLFGRIGAKIDNSATQSILNEDSMGVLFFGLSLVPGIVEELLFRGVLLPSYLHRGKWPAIFLSSFLFAFLHGQPIAFLMQFSLGVLLAYLCWESRSIYPGMLCHALHNGITGVLVHLSSAVGGEVQLAEELEHSTQLLTQGSVGELALTFAPMILFGALVLAVSINLFRRLCREDRKKQAARGLYADEIAQLSHAAMLQERPRFAYAGVWIGLIASLIINVLGAVSQFFI